MINKLFKDIQFFYNFFLFVIIANIAYIAYEVNNKKILTIDYSKNLSEALLRIDTMRKRNIANQVNELLMSDKIKSLPRYLEEIDSNTKRLLLLYNDNKDRYTNASNELHLSLDKMLTFPEISSLLRVIDNKLAKFNSYVEENNWKTLTRIGQRLKAITFLKKNFSHLRVLYIEKALSQNIQIMKTTTESSALAKIEKERIFEQLESIKVELKILADYIKMYDEFIAKVAEYETSIKELTEKLSPKIILESQKFQHSIDKVVFHFYLLFSFCIFLIPLGFLYFSWNSTKKKKYIADNVLDFIKKGVIKGEAEEGMGLGNDFISEINKLNYYIQKRLSFSSIFQEALPFPAIVLNQNLKVSWANSLFCNTFKIKNHEFEIESLSWDYIARFTNLIEHDPVIDALNDNVAGIFQIKIKLEKNSDSIPFEMYISPVINMGEKRIMIIFYPLTSMEETIINQGLMIVNPINKMLDELLHPNDSKEEMTNLENEFSSANMVDLFYKLNEIKEKFSNQKVQLIKEIETLENSLKDNFKIIYDLQFKVISILNNFVDDKNKLLNLKNHIIEYFENNSMWENRNKELTMEHKKLIGMNKEAINFSVEVISKIDNAKQTMKNIVDSKREARKMKENIMMLGERVVQSLEKALIFENVENEEVKKICQSFSKVKYDIAKVSSEIICLDKVLSTFDVQLTKMDLLLNNEYFSKFNLSNSKDFSILIEKSFEEHLELKNSIEKKEEIQENEIAESLEKVFYNKRINLDSIRDVNRIIEKFLSEENQTGEQNEILPHLLGNQKILLLENENLI